MSFLKKLQRQPRHIKKMILWGAVIIVGLGLAVWWIYSSYREIKKFQTEKFIEELNLPEMEIELPKMEIPKKEEL